MKKILAILLALAIAGCANIEKVEGDQVLNNRLAVKLPEAWNKLPAFGQPYETSCASGPASSPARRCPPSRPGAYLQARKRPACRPTPQAWRPTSW